MITFEQARDIVAANVSEFHEVSPWGWGNDDTFILAAGSHEDIYGRTQAEDEAYAEVRYLNDPPLRLVNRNTGAYSEAVGLLGALPALPNLLPINNPPEDGELDPDANPGDDE